MELKLFISKKLDEIFSVIGGGTEMNPKSYNQYKSQISSKSLAEKLGLNPSMLNEILTS